MSAAASIPETPAAELTRMINGYWVTQMIYVAAQLAIPDALAEGPRTAEDLATACGAHSRSLYRLLRALAGLGLFSLDGEGRFGLTPLSELLRAEAPHSLRGLALYSADPRLHRYRAWGHLLEAIRTGEPAFARLLNMTPFEYLKAHPDAAYAFDAAMESYTAASVQAVLGNHDFGGCRHVVDVGGGGGRMLCEILARYPELRGTVFDLPHVAGRAAAAIARAGLQERADAVGGDFFDHVVAGADLYLLKCVLHDWGDESALPILQSCRAAMTLEGRLLLAEIVVGPITGPPQNLLMDLNMLVIHGGLERTEAEFASLLERSGFALTRVVITGGPVDLLEARPI